MSSSSSNPLITATATFTGEAGQALSTVLNLAASQEANLHAASILDRPHQSPAGWHPSQSPIVLFCIQAGIIIILTRIIALALHKLQQPKVISEVVAGILLGPSVFGRIPGFTDAIFPAPSLPYLDLVSSIGLILFLFVVGMEVDFTIFRRNARRSVIISLCSLVIPFGLGAAVAVGVYDNFIDTDRVTFSHFLLFIAVAMAITAFPVLSRILTELSLLQTDVGVTVLAAGVANDVVGWSLLALAVALVSSGEGVTVVYVLLCAVGWCLLLVYAARPLLVVIARKSGSFENGPSNFFMVVTILFTLASSFVTSIIGIHAIFGAFVVGIIMPKQNGLARHLTEKIEDLVSVLFLPIYFAFSGLRTDLGLLNDGSIWGYAVCVIVVAFLSKFLGSSIPARFCGFGWRESAAIGSLMSCKGLVELIVLNIGLDARILNDQVFAMFVLMALVTTFLTTPLVLIFYPARLRRPSGPAVLENESRKSSSEQSPPETDAFTSRSRFVVVLSRLEHLPAIMAITKLLHKPLDYWHEKEGNASPPAISIDALRLLELTDRTSAVQRAASLEETAAQDPLRNIYNTFASLNGFDVTPDMVVVPSTEYASTVVEFANIKHSDIIMLPWGSFDHHFSIETFSESEKENHSGPFDALFKPPPTPTSHGSPQHAAFIRHVFSEAFCDVGLFLDCSGFGSAPAVSGGHQHIFLPFFGGRDDRLALSLLVQLCHHPGVTASCVRFHYEAKSGTGTATSPVTPHTPASAPPAASSVSVVHSEDKSSSMADDLLWQRFFGPGHQPQPSTLQALSRIDRREMTTSTPLDTLQDELKQVSSQHSSQAMVLVGRHDDGHRSDLNTKLLKELSASEGPIMPYFKADGDVRRTVGSVAHAVLLSGLAGSMLVMQAARKQRGNRSRKSSLVV